MTKLDTALFRKKGAPVPYKHIKIVVSIIPVYLNKVSASFRQNSVLGPFQPLKNNLTNYSASLI